MVLERSRVNEFIFIPPCFTLGRSKEGCCFYESTACFHFSFIPFVWKELHFGNWLSCARRFHYLYSLCAHFTKRNPTTAHEIGDRLFTFTLYLTCILNGTMKLKIPCEVPIGTPRCTRVYPSYCIRYTFTKASNERGISGLLLIIHFEEFSRDHTLLPLFSSF